MINENTDARAALRDLFTRKGTISCQVATGMETARVSELIMQAAHKKVLVADSSKWEK